MKKTYSIPTARIIILNDDDLIATSTPLANSATGYRFRSNFYSEEDEWDDDGL